MIYEFQAQLRKDVGKKVDGLRHQGFIPAVIYGPEVKENVLIFLATNLFRKLYTEAGESSIINLTVEGEKEPREVLIKEVKFDAVKDLILHVDFYQIKRGQKLEIEVELNFVGEAPAVKTLGGILMENLDKIHIKCLPKDIVSEIDVDLSSLKTFEDKISVKDIKFPETVEVLTDLNDLIVHVAEPKVEKEVVAEVAPVEGEVKPEVKEEEKTEKK